MFKKLLVPTLVLAMSAFAGVGCRDNSGDATPFPDGGDGSTDTGENEDLATPVDSADAPSTDLRDAPTTDGGDATSTEVGGDATSDATPG